MHRALRHTSPRRGTFPVAAVLAVAVALPLGACDRGAPSAPAAASTASPGSSSTPSPSTSMDMSAGHGAAATTAGTAAAADQGAGAGIRLQSLLGQHTALAADMMRARMSNAPDFAQAAETTLTRNTQALSTLLGSLAGTRAATAFSKLWTAHVTHLFAYAEARRGKDTAGLASARKALSADERAVAASFATASKGRLSRATAATQLKRHVGELLTQADSYAAGHYARAATAYRDGYEQAYAFGGTLAKGLLPRRVVPALATPNLQLRSGLTQLLGEHVALVVASMRAVTGKTADFRALGTQLNRNTVGLATAVDTLYGAPAAKAFQSLWSDHVDALLTITQAADRGDAAGQREGQKRLRAFEPGLADLLNGATQSRIGAKALAHAYVMHDEMLVAEVKAYQAKDYAKAHDLSYQAYDEMYGLAAQLANAIALSIKSKLPRGGSQTGGGGTARGR